MMSGMAWGSLHACDGPHKRCPQQCCSGRRHLADPWDASRPPPLPACLPPLPSGAQLSVQGMHCSACSTAVEAALRALPGVLSADVALLSASADVRLDSAACSPEAALAAVEGCGFEALLVSSTPEEAPASGRGRGGGATAVRLAITGMHCGACSSAVEAALAAVPGVQSAAVSLSTHQAEVRHGAGGGGKALEQALLDAVEGCGFEATGERACWACRCFAAGCAGWRGRRKAGLLAGGVMCRPWPSPAIPPLPPPCPAPQCWAQWTRASSCCRCRA